MAAEKDQRLSAKRDLSHRSLWNAKELLGDVQRSVIYLDGDGNAKKLLNYLVRFFEILDKFCDVYFHYKLPNNINRFNNYTCEEIENVCGYLIQIVNFIKVRVSVLLRDNEKSQDIIRHVFFKAIAKMQRYLVAINFYNKEMFRRSVLSQN